MGNISEVKTVFTVDLKPFADGLKTMLGMTTAAAAQIKPILNFDVKTANFSAIDSQLKGLAERTTDYLKTQQETIPVVDNAASGEKKHGDAADDAGKKLENKSTSLKHVKREALESFGAISFLALGIVQLSSTAAGGSQKLDKLSNSLSSGISAGFGFAGMISMIAPAAGPAAAGVGILAASVITLMKYFDDSEEKERRMQAALNDVRQSMRGASSEDLETYRNRLVESEKAALSAAMSYDKMKQALPANDVANKAEMLAGYNREMARGTEYARLRGVIDQELNSREKTAGEVRLYIKQAEIAATKNQFEQQRLAATEAYKKDQDDYRGHADALEAARKKHKAAMVKIAESEAQFNQQIADQKFEAELNRIRLQGVQSGAQQEQIDMQILDSRGRHYNSQYKKLSDLGSNASTEQIQQRAQLETTLTQIELDKAQKRIEIRRAEFESKLRLADIEGQRQIAAFKQESFSRGDSPEKIAAGQIAIEQKTTQGIIDEYNKRIAAGEKLSQQELERVAQLNAKLVDLAAEGARGEIDAREKLKDAKLSILEMEGKSRNEQQAEELAQVNDWLAKVKQTYGVTAEDINRAEQAAADRRVQITKEAETRKQQSIIEGALGIANDLASATSSILSLTEQHTSKEVGEEKKRRLAALDTEKEKKLALAKSSNERNAIEKDYAEKKELVEKQMNEKAKAANADAFAAQQAFSIAQATVATYEMATKAYNAVVGIPIIGPALAVAAAAAAITAGLANVAVIASQEVPGLAQGGELEKGKPGFIEGYETEIIAPKRTFIQVFREDLMPEVMKVITSGHARDIMMPQVRESVLAAPAQLLRQNAREIASEAERSLIEMNSQGNNNSPVENTRSVVHHHYYTIHAEMSDADKVVKKLKEALEDSGQKDITKLITNTRSGYNFGNK